MQRFLLLFICQAMLTGIAMVQYHRMARAEIAYADRLNEEVALYHHERYDGHGYPKGLAGEDIPAHAWVTTIADAYDAMHSNRIYRKGLPYDVIRQELVRGRQFDSFIA